jgi:tetratricopeptide (TPR) repeat protein
MLGAIARHARNYPPAFDSEADRRRAVEDTKALSTMLDMLVKGPAPIPELLFRAADLHAMGHNLGIDGEAAKADARYKALVALTPDDARARFAFGAFLGNSARPAEALPHLEKAARGGIVEAHYALGISYLGLGDAKKALQQLELYRARRPDDASVGQLIEGIRSGKVRVQRRP